MTVRGFMVPDDYEGLDLSLSQMAALEDSFRRGARHEWCWICTKSGFAMRAFVWPRKGFGEFGLDEKPALVQSVQPV